MPSGPSKIERSRCLVTGGAGFIGSNLVSRLLRLGAKEVVVLDNFLRGNRANLQSELASYGNLRFVVGDIRDREVVSDLMDNIDFVFHNAVVRASLAELEPDLCRDIMVTGTSNIFESASKHRVKKLIFSSSATVYGEPEYLPIDERHPLKGKSSYARAKIEAEMMLPRLRCTAGLNYIILRYFNVYGPRCDLTSPFTEVIPRWLSRIRDGQAPLIYGRQKKIYDFTFVDDVVDANILAVEKDLGEGVFNIGTGVGTDLTRLARVMLRLAGSTMRPQIIAPETRVVIFRRIANTSLARQTLGFTAKTPLSLGLEKLVLWFGLNK